MTRKLTHAFTPCLPYSYATVFMLGNLTPENHTLWADKRVKPCPRLLQGLHKTCCCNQQKHEVESAPSAIKQIRLKFKEKKIQPDKHA